MPITAPGNKIIQMSPSAVTAISSGTIANASVGIYVTYIGTEASATFEVSAGGDMTFKHGAAGSEAVDSGIGSSGVLDLSTPAAGRDTVGELVDEINRSANWRASIWGMIRSDVTDNRFFTMSATQCKGLMLPVPLDDLVTPFTDGLRFSFTNTLGGRDGGYRFCLTSVEFTHTHASAITGAIKVFACNPVLKTDRLIWQGVTTASAASGTDTINSVDFGDQPLMGRVGESLCIQLANSAAPTGVKLQANGYAEQIGSGDMQPWSKSDL